MFNIINRLFVALAPRRAPTPKMEIKAQNLIGSLRESANRQRKTSDVYDKQTTKLDTAKAQTQYENHAPSQIQTNEPYPKELNLRTLIRLFEKPHTGHLTQRSPIIYIGTLQVRHQRKRQTSSGKHIPRITQTAHRSTIESATKQATQNQPSYHYR